jgi:hypothetical protein
MYIGYDNREYEDLEMDNMRRDAREQPEYECWPEMAEQARLTEVAQWWREGLVSSREVVAIWRGQTV